MYSFPKRPGPKYCFQRRRTWNAHIPFADEVVLHWSADACYRDPECTIPCDVGDAIEAVKNLTAYPGLNAVPIGTDRMQYVLDSGFPAIYCGSPSSDARNRVLRTTGTANLAMQIVVFRCATSTWGNYGAALGAHQDVSLRNYLFAPGGTGFYNPPTMQRQNGVDQPPGSALVGIAVPFIAAFGHNAITPKQWEVGTSSDLNSSVSYTAGLYLYEALGFSAMLATEQIVEIEAYLKDKYGIA